MSLRSTEAVSLIRSLRAFLEEEAPAACLAAPEDADYFRTVAKNQMVEGTAEKKEAPPKLVPVAPPPLKAAEPKIEPDLSVKPVHPPMQAAIPTVDEAKPDLQPNLRGDLPRSLPAPPPVPMPEITQTKAKESPRLNAVSLADVRKVFAQAFPQFPLLDEIPSDAIAIKIAERWKTKNKTAPISILSLHEPPEQRALLEQIAKAIDATLFPARVVNAETIEKEKQWEAFLSAPGLKVTIACDYTLWQLNHLMSFYKENPTQGTRTLGTIPLFLLPDLSLYLKDPLLKRSLWKALCQKLSS